MSRSLPPPPGVAIDADPADGPPSFEQFYAEAWRPAFRLASFLIQSTAAGEEIAQEALLGLYRHWESVDQPEAYLRRALVNGAGNWRRHETLGCRPGTVKSLASRALARLAREIPR